MKIDIVLPVQNIDVQNCYFTSSLTDSIYLYVNKRPVRGNKIEKVEHISKKMYFLLFICILIIFIFKLLFS